MGAKRVHKTKVNLMKYYEVSDQTPSQTLVTAEEVLENVADGVWRVLVPGEAQPEGILYVAEVSAGQIAAQLNSASADATLVKGIVEHLDVETITALFEHLIDRIADGAQVSRFGKSVAIDLAEDLGRERAQPLYHFAVMTTRLTQ